MRKQTQIFVVLILVMMLAACSTSQPSAPEHAIVTAQSLIVYSCPSLSCDQVGVVGANDQLHIDGQAENRFFPIRYFGATRYVPADGITLTQ